MANRVFQLKVPAEPSSLACLRSFVATALAAQPDPFVDCVVHALDEACSNVVRHRHPGLGCSDIELTIELSADQFRCRIGSFCAARDLPAIRPRREPQLEPGGLGTHFIACLMDRVEYEPDPERPGAMLLVLEKRLPEASQP